MKLSRISAILATLAATIPNTSAYIEITEPYCDEVRLGRARTEEVCATMQVAGPSPVVLDGNYVYLGDYSVDYFYHDKYDGVNFHVEWAGPPQRADTKGLRGIRCDDSSADAKHLRGIRGIRCGCDDTADSKGLRGLRCQDDSNKGTDCTALIDGERCNSCRRRNVDGKDQIAVDCTNIPFGRAIRTYQTIGMGTMFFPLGGTETTNVPDDSASEEKPTNCGRYGCN